MGANANLNLHHNNNFKVTIKADELFRSSDIVFYIQKFNIPSISINTVDVKTNGLKVPYPSQASMVFEDLNLTILVDDKLLSYLELLKWMHRLKDPEKLFKAPLSKNINVYSPKYQKLKENLEATMQYPLEYRDIIIKMTDTNHQVAYTFVYRDAWIQGLSGLVLASTESEYVTVDATFKYMFLEIYNAEDTRIIPILDYDQNSTNFDEGSTFEN